MKNITSKVTVILSVILFVISICSVSSLECLKGFFPIQRTIINNEDVIHGLMCSDIKSLQYERFSLFYIGLFLIMLSSIICFTKSNKITSTIRVTLSLIPVIFVIVTHNYIWFMILMNIYLVGNILLGISFKNKISMFSNIISIIVFTINEIQIFRHLQLPSDLNNMEIFTSTLIILSNTTLKIYMLWLIPYIILLINDIVIIHKHSIGGNS